MKFVKFNQLMGSEKLVRSPGGVLTSKTNELGAWSLFRSGDLW